MAPRCHKAPEAVQHLRAERSRSVQNYPTPLPKERRELSAEAKASAQQSAEAKASAQETLKNRGKNSPINLHCSKSSKLAVQAHRNLPLHRSTAGSLANSRNPHVNLFRTSAWFANTYNK
uniref:Uncharacterized protein n=1 Tax=Heterorhabditis bacteriophora TaxID=37862 RepID=A0A1I7WIG3_HETBA